MSSANSPSELLEAAYEHLGFHQGNLLPARSQPETEVVEEWIDKGDWQALAAQVGAESIFFVERDPVVVFANPRIAPSVP
jgi:hypothetical protein